MASFYDANGNPVNFSQKLGEGGEGAVFDVEGKPNIVAKIYHETIHPRKEEKLRSMVLLKNESLQNIAAWPVETLQTKRGKISGFIMPKITGYKPIHELYSPKSRRQEFPHADWRFLLHVAANAARAVSVIHQNGHVIGDLNHGNLVVAANGLVKLIDCDSFQVQLQEQKFLCEVGVVEYTPPELHGADFTKTSRSSNHDAFGLSVLLFHLLFMGRHPFAGRFLGHGDMPIYKAIREHRFAYSAQAQKFQMQPPPFTLPATALPQDVFGLFEKAFLGNGLYAAERPTAAQWLDAITNFSTQLRTCSINPSHHFFNSLSACPWCKLEKDLGVDLFVINTAQIHIAGFSLNTLWLSISNIKSPGRAEFLPLPQVQPGEVAKQVRKSKIITKAFAVGIFIAGMLLGLALFNTGFFWVMWIAGLLAAHMIWKKEPVKNKILLKYSIAKSRYDAALSDWESQAGDAKFRQKFNELEDAKNEYLDIDNFRNRELTKLKNKLRENQLNRYLEKFRITDFKFDNIGVERKSMLLSYGIENASDINKKDVQNVPGFGRVLTQKLLEWRAELEAKFVFNPNVGVDPRDIADLDRKIAAKKKQLENILLQGPTELNKIRQQILMARDRIKPRLIQTTQEFAQAEADWNYISGVI